MSEIKQFLKEAEALMMLGALPLESLPDWALSVLSSGVESDDILQLAICSADQAQELRRLFENVLAEYGGGHMSKPEALKIYARRVSLSIVNGEISPKNGANLIWDATIKAKQRGFHELDPFIYAASEIDSRPDDREFFEDAIREEAKRWAAVDV